MPFSIVFPLPTSPSHHAKSHRGVVRQCSLEIKALLAPGDCPSDTGARAEMEKLSGITTEIGRCSCLRFTRRTATHSIKQGQIPAGSHVDTAGGWSTMLLSVPWRPEFCSCGYRTLFISHLLQCLFGSTHVYFIQQPSRLGRGGPQEKFRLLKGGSSHSTLPEGGKNHGRTPVPSSKVRNEGQGQRSPAGHHGC